MSNFSDENFPNYEKVTSVHINTLDKIIITQTDVLRELLNMKCNKADGPPEIPIILLKKCAHIFSEILFQLFQKILLFEKFLIR